MGHGIFKCLNLKEKSGFLKKNGWFGKMSLGVMGVSGDLG